MGNSRLLLDNVKDLTLFHLYFRCDALLLEKVKEGLYSWKVAVFDSADRNAEDHEKIRVQVGRVSKSFWRFLHCRRYKNGRHFSNSIFKQISFNRMTSFSILNTKPLKCVPQCLVHNKTSIIWNISLAPTSQQDLVWTSGSLVYWHINASFGLD